jgi:hypothetical protein
MLLFFKRFMLVAAATLFLAQNASGFALMGPRDTWQVSTIGYDPLGGNFDLGGPKNLGEEWRWPIPEITYGYDESFLNFFGTNGMNAVNAAFEAFNREMTNFSGLSFAALRAKPLQTRRLHMTAQTLGVLDVKSAAMSLIIEHLGLDSAERYTWTLRSRATPAPNVTNYIVIQRNFDPFTYTPTPYVNGALYSYQIKSYPARFNTVDFESTSVFPVRQSQQETPITLSATIGDDLTSVPDLSLKPGVYYAGLTRDDIGGLKYIYSRDNVNTEDVIAGTTNRVVDLRTTVYLQGIDAFGFFTNAFLNSPSNLLTQFPALQFALRTNTVFGIASNILSTNVIITNVTSSGPFTDYGNLTIITNLDLFTFSEMSRTNGTGLLQTLAPGLIITSTNTFPEVVTNEVYYLTNYPWMPAGSFPVVATNFVKSIETRYKYTYLNVVTNYKSSTSDLEVDTVSFTGTSVVTNRQFFKNKTNLTSGGFFVIDQRANPNLVGYSFLSQTGDPLVRVTNVIPVTNITVFNNVIRQTIHNFTNVAYAAYPILLNSGTGQSVLTTNVVPTPVVRYTYTLENFTGTDIFGNPAHFLLVPSDTNLLQRVVAGADANANMIVQTIDLTNPLSPVISNSVIPSTAPLGVVLIYDPTQFQLDGTPIFTSGLATNTITAFTDPATGRSFTQLLIYQTNSALFPAHPILLQSAAGPVQRAGVNSIKFKQIPFTDFLSQSTAISTNTYSVVTFANGLLVTNTFQRVAGPDILISAADLGVSPNGFPFPLRRSIQWQQGTTLIAPGTFFDGGPGLIVPPQTFTFSKILPYNFNENPNFTDEQNANQFFTWGSFDSRTITPRLYPEDLNTQVTLQLLESLALNGRTP